MRKPNVNEVFKFFHNWNSSIYIKYDLIVDGNTDVFYVTLGVDAMWHPTPTIVCFKRVPQGILCSMSRGFLNEFLGEQIFSNPHVAVGGAPFFMERYMWDNTLRKALIEIIDAIRRQAKAK